MKKQLERYSNNIKENSIKICRKNILILSHWSLRNLWGSSINLDHKISYNSTTNLKKYPSNKFDDTSVKIYFEHIIFLFKKI